MTLRPIHESDISLVQVWLEKPYVKRWFEDPKGWMAELCDRDGKYSFIKHFIALVDEDDHIMNPIGFGQYYDCMQSGKLWKGIDLEGVFSIDFLIGEKQFLGHGYGKELVRQLCQSVWADTTASRIVVDPDKDNIACRSSLLANAFYLDAKTGLLFQDRIDIA